jgi:predicted phosphodiesterase
MRVFAISDLHLDYEENERWLRGLSSDDYRDDVLILAGDVSDEEPLLTLGFRWLTARFRAVQYVPGNHDLWLTGGASGLATSFDKFTRVCAIAAEYGVSMVPFQEGSLSIVPLLGWYDYSFGVPEPTILARWMDFRRCKWPAGVTADDITRHFLALNEPVVYPRAGTVISFSHFLPRIDVMPATVPAEHQLLYPVLGASALDAQVKRLASIIHVYGHSHLNRDVVLEGRRYINNAFGNPREERIAAKRLRCIYGE